MTSSALSRAPVLLAIVLALAAGCSDDGDDEGPGSSASSAGDVLLSGLDDPFELVEHDGTNHVVGHRVLIEVPDDWTEYGPEELSPNKEAHLWSVGQPTDTQPFPAGLQFEMAAPAGRHKTGREPLQRSMVLMEITPGYRMIDSGEAVVPGAVEAAFHRFENQIEVGGEKVQAERVHLFVQTGPNTWSTIRFISPSAEFDSLLKPVYESVRITRAE